MNGIFRVKVFTRSGSIIVFDDGPLSELEKDLPKMLCLCDPLHDDPSLPNRPTIVYEQRLADDTYEECPDPRVYIGSSDGPGSFLDFPTHHICEQRRLYDVDEGYEAF